MSGYKPEPLGRNPMPSAGEWLTLGVAVLMAAAILVSGIADRTGPAWLRRLGIAPVGMVEFLFAWTFLARARINGKGERFTPRQLRQTALVLGLVTVAFGLYSYFKGA